MNGVTRSAPNLKVHGSVRKMLRERDKSSKFAETTGLRRSLSSSPCGRIALLLSGGRMAFTAFLCFSASGMFGSRMHLPRPSRRIPALISPWAAGATSLTSKWQ